MSKLLVVVGITGNQGNSVANHFLKHDPSYRIRGLTRNPSSAAAKSLSSRGIEVVAADLDDPKTLTPAFSGASLIFSVTNYWEPFFTPSYREEAAKLGISINQHAGDVERQRGKNIADAAAATVDTLDDNGFIASTLSHAEKCSGGRHKTCYHFDAKADVFPDYVNEKYPALAAKMSCVQTGYFMTSYKLVRPVWLSKQSDNTVLTSFPHSPTKIVPHLDVNADTGPFVYAVSRMPPGHDYMCAGTTATWPEYCQTWSKVTGVPCEFKQISPKEMVDAFPDEATGREIGDMFEYSGDVGYDGGMKLLMAEDLRKAGFECPVTSLEDFMKRQDYSDVLNA